MLSSVQANFEKYANGGGFVSSEVATSIVAAGPHSLEGGRRQSNGPAKFSLVL